MSTEVVAAIVVILGVVAEALRRAWMKADEQKRKEAEQRVADEERRRRAIADRDPGGLFNRP